MTLSPSFASKVAITFTALLAITGCQSIRKAPATVAPTTTPTAPVQPTPTTEPKTTISAPQTFDINGKIGVTTPQQTGSAFYTWGQNGNAFAIDLAGALNAGQTIIRYDGQTATLTNDKGTLTATNPEELLFKATQWQAPISQLPYWIMGQSAPSDTDNQTDAQNRLSTANNSHWTAEFSYANTQATLPNRITMKHPDGYKVVLTINRLN